MVELTDRASNFPTPFEKSKLWAGVEVAWIYHDKKDISKKDLAINLASSGYYRQVFFIISHILSYCIILGKYYRKHVHN